jgi:hypothetical protein
VVILRVIVENLGNNVEITFTHPSVVAPSSCEPIHFWFFINSTKIMSMAVNSSDLAQEVEISFHFVVVRRTHKLLQDRCLDPHFI